VVAAGLKNRPQFSWFLRLSPSSILYPSSCSQLKFHHIPPSPPPAPCMFTTPHPAEKKYLLYEGDVFCQLISSTQKSYCEAKTRYRVTLAWIFIGVLRARVDRTLKSYWKGKERSGPNEAIFPHRTYKSSSIYKSNKCLQFFLKYTWINVFKN
jgi:hypothetical protein